MYLKEESLIIKDLTSISSNQKITLNPKKTEEKLILTKTKICKIENKHVLERINKTRDFYSKRLIKLIPSLVGLVGKNRDEATRPPAIRSTVL